MKYNTNGSNFSRPGMRIGPGFITPFIKVMMILNAAIFVFQIIWPQITGYLGLIPKLFFSDFPNLLYQPFTYMFLHGSFGHILFNMFALWMFGTDIERTFSTKRFARFYLIGGLAGAILTLIVKPSQVAVMIGASAAIYAVLAAYWVMFPQRKLYIYFIVPVKVKYAIPGLMLLGFMFGGPNVAHFAHLGGAIFGFLYMKSNWRILSFSRKFKEYQHRRKQAKFDQNRQKAEEMMKKVDDILDKINDVGIEKLSKEERKILEDASDKLSEKN